jgi:hypothetical protein
MDDEVKEFELALRMNYKNYLLYIQDRCKYLFEEAIYRQVYSYYTPYVYRRTFQLANKVTTKIIGEELFVYIDIDYAKYNSAVSGAYVSPIVPWLIEHGHTDDRAVLIHNNQYTNYEGRHYLRLAKELVQKEFDVNVTIIDDRPDYIEW